MTESISLAQLLRESLDKVTPPRGYEALRARLVNSRPSRELPTVKESPENLLPISNDA